ncbi:MAG: glycosyl hydrolase, partial [Terrimicrobiaceae bacterium]
MKSSTPHFAILSLAILSVFYASSFAFGSDTLKQGFLNPPQEARPWVYFWWQNNLVNKEGITKDLEEIKSKGIAGVLLACAGGAAGPMPDGPDFMSPEWRELMKHAISEAARLG